MVGYHLEMKAFKVQISNPIAAEYFSDLACCHHRNACNFLQGRVLECEVTAVIKEICMVVELIVGVRELCIVKSTQCQH